MDLTGFEKLTKEKVHSATYNFASFHGKKHREGKSPMLRIPIHVSKYLLTKSPNPLKNGEILERLTFDMHYNKKELFIERNINGRFVLKSFPLSLYSALFLKIVKDYPILWDKTTRIPLDIIDDENNVGLLIKLTEIEPD